jgi:hypothetical protein
MFSFGLHFLENSRLLHDEESQIGGERGFDHPGPLHFDSLGADVVEQSDTRTEQYGRQVDLHLVHEPGAASVIPVPTEIEHAEPGGVSCTTRKSSSPARWSTSRLKPAFSV